ncbi:hypothetical protein [Thermomonas sp.]|uniref:hypothetical protein n=1 Tax=Thermomonas sp. TaxID=1971895 RepID=UPI0035AE7A72
MSRFIIEEDQLAKLEIVRGLASLQAWIFEEIETTPGGRGLPGVEISALGQAMHHLLSQALDSAQFSAGAATG